MIGRIGLRPLHPGKIKIKTTIPINKIERKKEKGFSNHMYHPPIGSINNV